MTKETLSLTAFATDILAGLRSKRKSLPSKYFYDETGDQLFQQIMHLDEYYLTRKEFEIFSEKKQEILSALYKGEPFRIIELGAGDGLKTKILLSHFLANDIAFTYTPVDISGNVLSILEQNLKNEMPNLQVAPYVGDYFDALAEITDSPEKDVVFFLGSNVGNFPRQEAEAFLRKLQTFLKPGDLLFMGVDLKKDPSAILSAYNDARGVTRAFNLNLLQRINRELAGNFDLEKFMHYPYYNPDTGECRSYLISTENQQVTLAGEVITFHAWEAIFMEVSKKYDPQQLSSLAESTGFLENEVFSDAEQWFADVLWSKD